MNTYQPDYAIHPGCYLEEVLESRGIKKNDFARRAGITAKAVSQIINGKALYSPERALDFERTLGIKAEIWIHLADCYQLFQVKKKEEKKLAAADARNWLKSFPVADLKKMGIVPATRHTPAVAEAILRFFNVSSPDACRQWMAERAVAFRKSSAFRTSVEAVSLWIKLAENKAVEIPTRAFHKEKFRQTVRELRGFTVLPAKEYMPRLVTECANAGVAFVSVPELKGTHISGASWWAADKAIIALSLRHKTNDHFWFTFFHECAHVLLHGKKGIFLDLNESGTTPEELEANSFAQDLLIVPGDWKRFTGARHFTEKAILDFACAVGIHPAVVVGRLQHEGLLEHSRYFHLKEKTAFLSDTPEETSHGH